MIIVKVPGINGLGKTSGARDAGKEMLKGIVGDFRHEEIHVDNSNLEEQEELIRKNAVKLFGEEGKVVFLGGDHSISFPLVDSFRKVRGEDVKLVVFDAHADCMKPMKEPTHEEWLRALIEKGFRGENVMLIGASKIEKEELDYLEKEKIIMIKPDEVVGDIDGVVLKVKEFVKGKEIYVSFDMDVFKDVKATGYPEGEMGEEEVMKLLDVVLGSGKLVGCDIVEVHLDKKKENVEETLRLVRKVLGKFIGK